MAAFAPPQSATERGWLGRTPRHRPVKLVALHGGWPASGWERLAIGAIMLLSIFMNFFKLGAGGFGNLYYAAGVRSMLDSWHNLFFVSFDPGGFVSLDKPPLGFAIQAASAKLLGFSPFSVLLPQALAGVLAVLLLYYLVRRSFGTVAGLVAALALAVSPISVVTNRNNTVDSTLALVMLIGAWAVLRAVETGRLRWLLACAVVIGIGFDIKMLEAYLVVPAFGLVYLLASPVRWPWRIAHLATAGVLLAVLTLSWLVAVDLTPADARPFVGSTQDNSEMSLALGYNGMQRLVGMFGPRGGSGGLSSLLNLFDRGNAPGGPPGGFRPGDGGANAGGQARFQDRAGAGANGGTGQAPANGATTPGDGGAFSGQPGGPAAPGASTGPGAPGGAGGIPGDFPGGAGGFPGGAGGFPGGLGDFPGGPGGFAGGPVGGPGGGPGGMFDTGFPGPLRLFIEPLGGQTGWLLPAAIFGMLAVLWRRRPRPRSDRQLQSVILWGGWLLTMGVFFSIAGFFHQYYLTVMAPAIAALSGIGIGTMWRDFRDGNWRGWLLPFALVATLAEQVMLVRAYPEWAQWLIPLTIGTGAAG